MNEFLRHLLALPPQASSFAKSVDQLHYFVISATMFGATITALVAIVFVVRYRRRGDELTEHVSAPVWLEATWIGLLLTLFLVWWVIGYRLYIRMEVPPKDAMEVYVTAKQWMWKFAYPDGKSSISVLTVPAGRPVRLTMTSRDVIHSFSVPAFRTKQDVLPGTYTSLWFEAPEPGSYQILCAEYCGVGHSVMRGRVDVLSADDYEAWLEGRDPMARRHAEAITAAERPKGGEEDEIEAGIEAGASERMDVRGREVAVRHGCLACHTLDGRRHIGPSFAGLYMKEVTLQDGRKVIADPAYLTESMMDPRAKVVSGFQPVMPTFQGLLSAGETAALVELIRSVASIPRDGTFPGRGPVPDVTPWQRGEQGERR